MDICSKNNVSEFSTKQNPTKVIPIQKTYNTVLYTFQHEKKNCQYKQQQKSERFIEINKITVWAKLDEKLFKD